MVSEVGADGAVHVVRAVDAPLSVPAVAVQCSVTLVAVRIVDVGPQRQPRTGGHRADAPSIFTDGGRLPTAPDGGRRQGRIGELHGGTATGGDDDAQYSEVDEGSAVTSRLQCGNR